MKTALPLIVSSFAAFPEAEGADQGRFTVAGGSGPLAAFPAATEVSHRPAAA